MNSEDVRDPGRAVRDLPFLHAAEEDLDTPSEQALVLLRDLRESFAPTYLTLISIIEGVLLGLTFELVSEGRATAGGNPLSWLLVFNNVVYIALVWNEYRMGASMFRWIPSLLDAVIPFTLGALQAILILTTSRPLAWLACLAFTYLAATIAYENMYRRAAEEQRNGLVLTHNRIFRRLNPLCCVGLAGLLGLAAASHAARGTEPGVATLLLATAANVLFLIRGELNWLVIVRATRSAAARA